jgi:hypothetical protein
MLPVAGIRWEGADVLSRHGDVQVQRWRQGSAGAAVLQPHELLEGARRFVGQVYFVVPHVIQGAGLGDETGLLVVWRLARASPFTKNAGKKHRVYAELDVYDDTVFLWWRRVRSAKMACTEMGHRVRTDWANGAGYPSDGWIDEWH